MSESSSVHNHLGINEYSGMDDYYGTDEYLGAFSREELRRFDPSLVPADGSSAHCRSVMAALFALEAETPSVSADAQFRVHSGITSPIAANDNNIWPIALP